jgi:hypothetical protein
MKIPSLIFCALLLVVGITVKGQNTQIIQFNIGNILNARPVTTLTNNKLISWTKGIDGNGTGDGYLTLSAALFNGDKEPHALPDSAVIAANSVHPEIKLHYSNRDSVNYQTCNIRGEGIIEFTTLNLKYEAIFLALTSSEGLSYLKIKLNYSDGSSSQNFTLPDYYSDIKANDASFSYLVHDLAKWGNRNNMTEKNHHNIDLLRINIDRNRILKSIGIEKSKPGYLVFWAATGKTVK